MDLRKLLGAHQRIVSLSIAQRPETWLRCLPRRSQSYIPELGQGRRGRSSEATCSSASTDVSSHRASEASRVCGACGSASARCARCGSASRVLRTMVDRFLDSSPRVVDECVDAIGSRRPDVGPSSAHLTAFRRVFAQAIGAAEPRERPAVPPECDVQGGLLEAWARHCGDPDIGVATWATIGAPAGITEHPGQPGIFPDKPDCDAVIGLASMDFPDPRWRESYREVERSDHALDEVGCLVRAGYLTVVDTLEACTREVALSCLSLASWCGQSTVKRSIVSSWTPRGSFCPLCLI